MFGNVQRWGTPQSTQVQTLQELQKPWTDSLAAFENQAAQEASAPPDGSGQRNAFNQMVVNRFAGTPNMTNSQIERAADSYWNSAYSAARQGGSAGADKFFSDGQHFNFGDLVEEVSAPTFDWNAYNAGMKAIADPFNEAVTRQQQAYGQMQGGNYFGGMINENYTNPNANQITGQTTGGLGGLGGFGGLAQSTPAGLAAQGQATTFGSMPTPPAAPRGPNQLRAGGLGGLGGFGGPFRGS